MRCQLLEGNHATQSVQHLKFSRIGRHVRNAACALSARLRGFTQFACCGHRSSVVYTVSSTNESQVLGSVILERCEMVETRHP